MLVLPNLRSRNNCVMSWGRASACGRLQSASLKHPQRRQRPTESSRRLKPSGLLPAAHGHSSRHPRPIGISGWATSFARLILGAEASVCWTERAKVEQLLRDYGAKADIVIKGGNGFGARRLCGYRRPRSRLAGHRPEHPPEASGQASDERVRDPASLMSRRHR